MQLVCVGEAGSPAWEVVLWLLSPAVCSFSEQHLDLLYVRGWEQGGADLVLPTGAEAAEVGTTHS